jgi:hypothetical protein
VTYFAYWFGKEKVVARVVEKERAAAIYQAITSRQRDPALIELVGKDTFRARIFPVMPNADLKVEMRMVQVLPSSRQGATYIFPLQPVKAGTSTLEKLAINVRVKSDASIDRITNSFKLPVTKTSDSYRLHLTRLNYRPTRDWRIDLKRKPRPLHVAAYAAPSGGPDGFFALAITPNQPLRNLVVKISGQRTYDIVPARLPNARAHQALTLFGRYKGSGPATVTLTGMAPGGRRTLSQVVTFGSRRQDNNLATKLWAARRIAQLSGGGNKNRAAIVALSTRFMLPSAFTSWLAVPREEMAAFQREKADIDLQFYGRQISLLIRHGRVGTEEARDLRRRFEKAAREAGRDPRTELKYRLGDVVLELQDRLDAERKKGKKQNRARVAQLQRHVRLLERAGALHHEIVRRRIYAVEEELLVSRRQLEQLQAAETTAAGQRQQPRKQQLQQRVNRLAQRYDELLNTPSPPSQGGGGGGFRSGDPLISIEAPEDAEQIIALMPGGEVKKLLLNPDNKRWEARFDIPTYAAEGEYSITIIILLKDGTRRTLAFRYRVDMTAPHGQGRALLVDGGAPTLRLELDVAGDTTRVSALLPWGQKVELKPSTIHAHRFFVLVPMPASHRGKAFAITYVLTDGAHNRTTVTVDVSR